MVVILRHQPSSPLLPARYYAVLYQFLLQLGVDGDAIAARCELTIEQLQQPDARISLAQVEALVEVGLTHTGRHDLGFLFGKQLKLSSHAIVGYAILSSPTLDYALSLVARYFKLVTPTFRLQVRRQPQCFELAFTPALPMSHATMLLHLEAVITAFHEQVKTLLAGDMSPYDIRLSAGRPMHVELYAQLRPARVEFAAHTLPGAVIQMSQEMVRRRLALSDPYALKMAERQCEGLLQQMVDNGSTSDWVTMMLREADQALPGLDELAHILHISPRTLERHLAREGSRFLQLKNQTRLRKACEALETSRLSITQIALQLGYSDAANFSRAFRQGLGLSPSAYRNRHARE